MDCQVKIGLISGLSTAFFPLRAMGVRIQGEIAGSCSERAAAGETRPPQVHPTPGTTRTYCPR